MFEWDRNNLRKIRGHRLDRDEAEQALLNEPIPVYQQDVEGRIASGPLWRDIAGRLLVLVVTERGGNLRVITAYDLDAGQKRDYFERRALGE
jgi:hypothetical protein